MIKKILLLIIIVVIIAWLFAWPYPFSGDCMEPALKDGSYIFVNRALPYFRPYKIGDIIAFKHEDKTWVARITALENDTIEITDGNIQVNGKLLQDSIQRNWSNWDYGHYAINQPFTVPSGHFYVLSDNLAAHHDDSRVFGPVSKKSIIGLIWS